LAQQFFRKSLRCFAAEPKGDLGDGRIQNLLERKTRQGHV
jgi:hypothetical protein